MTNKTFRHSRNMGYNALREYSLIRNGIDNADLDILALDLANAIKQDSMVVKFSKYVRVKVIGTCVYVQMKNVILPNGGTLDKALANHLHAFFGGMNTSDDIKHSKQALKLNPMFKKYWMVAVDWTEFKTEYQKVNDIQHITRAYK